MHFMRTLPYAAVALSLVVFGCGESEETLEGEEVGEEWEATPTVSPTARLEYRIDSLMNENRRLKEQADAAVGESRRLTARNAELETKMTETPAPSLGVPVEAPAAGAGAIMPSGDANAAYNAALDLFRQRQYAEAATQFEGLLSSGISDQLAGNCHYWIGESYYALKKYDDAAQHFETVFDYKSTSKKPYAQFMIGNILRTKGDMAGAKEAYQKVATNYPTSDLAEKARANAAKIK
jgi:tol-pal system protein YbgF